MDLRDLYLRDIDILMWSWTRWRVNGNYYESEPKFLGNIHPSVKLISLANPESYQGVQNVLVESFLWLSSYHMPCFRLWT